MRIMLPILLFLCATAAFADQTTSVTIPFSFESQGKVFPASQYEVKLSDDRHHLTISTRQGPSKSMFLTVAPVSIDRNDTILSIKFEEVGGLHELRSIRVGEYQYQR
jgi:biopolymer transport protein ExbD